MIWKLRAAAWYCSDAWSSGSCLLHSKHLMTVLVSLSIDYFVCEEKVLPRPIGPVNFLTFARWWSACQLCQRSALHRQFICWSDWGCPILANPQRSYEPDPPSQSSYCSTRTAGKSAPSWSLLLIVSAFGLPELESELQKEWHLQTCMAPPPLL